MSIQLAPRPKNEDRRLVAVKELESSIAISLKIFQCSVN
jgi:hypothetical protein